jgi:hypothetical protein
MQNASLAGEACYRECVWQRAPRPAKAPALVAISPAPAYAEPMAKPRKKTSKGRKAAAPRVNKSAWIRAQSSKLSAQEVVSKAKAKGIKLSRAQVYTARSTGKAAGSAAGTHEPKVAAEATSNRDLRHEFIMIAARLGTEEAQRLLDRLVDVQTPMP